MSLALRIYSLLVGFRCHRLLGLLMHSGYLRRSEELAGTCCTVLPWNRSMWRIGCDTCIALPENGRMRNHLAAVRSYVLQILLIKIRIETVCMFMFFI